MRPEKFRYNAAITIAAVVAFFGAVPLATSRAYLLPILLVPILVAIWGWRAGTDVSTAGLRIRALFGSRLIPWPYVEALVPAGRTRVYAVLNNGRQLRLPAVSAADLPLLSEKSGTDRPEPEAPNAQVPDQKAPDPQAPDPQAPDPLEGPVGDNRAQ